MQEKPRVLSIDDDEKLGNLIRRILEPEHDVRVLVSARMALDAIGCGERFDVILCDLVLPGMSGMDFHDHLSSVAPDLLERVIFVTGGASTQLAADFLALPSIRHLAKPFTASELRRAVREHLARLRSESS
jgi:DNA-binding NtrC family response regulator